MGKQNHALGLILGAVGAFLGMLIFSVPIVLTSYAFGFISIASGAVAGAMTTLGYKKSNKSVEPRIVQIVGGVFGFLSVFLAYLLFVEWGAGFDLLLDFFFIGLAAYGGYWTSKTLLKSEAHNL